MRERPELVSGNGKGKGCLSWGERDASTTASAVCKLCGAERVNDRQIGSEKLHDCLAWARGENCAEKDWENACHVCRIVLVCRELKRVLRDDGIFVLNYGDSYSGSGNKSNSGVGSAKQKSNKGAWRAGRAPGLPSGNLVGIPFRIALALQADGWIWRQHLPWLHRSPMPESTKNRPAKALEEVFMFVKRMGYFYDDVAVKRSAEYGFSETTKGKFNSRDANGEHNSRTIKPGSGGTRNFWQADLWFDSVDKPHGLTGIGDELVGIDVTSAGSSAAHFATFPVALVTPFIKCSTSERGCCAKCGTPWVRIVEKTPLKRKRPNDFTKRTGEEGTGNSCANTVAGVSNNTLGWKPGCRCYGLEIIAEQPRKPSKGWNGRSGEDYEPPGQAAHSKARKLPADYKERRKQWKKDIKQWYAEFERLNPLYQACETVPCVVCDPFAGTGTVPVVAQTLGRRSIGIDLSEEYLKIAKKRISSRGMIGRERKPEPDDLFVMPED
jgi:DNA modification methylase